MSVPAEKPALSAFSSVKRGMSREAIEEILGAPTQKNGLGADVLRYDLSDGSSIEILYVHPQLIKIVHYRIDGTKMTWVPS